jgi:lipoprotein-anchoring transpeptidase ErfK/SrfK
MGSTERFDIGRRRVVLLSSSLAAGGLALAACSVKSPASSTGAAVVAAGPSAPTASSPAPGSTPAAVTPISLTSSLGTKVTGVPFAAPLRVAMWGGTAAARLTSVALTGAPSAAVGTFDETHRRWSLPALTPGATYRLTAVASDGAKTVTFKRSFRTAAPAKTLTATFSPTGLGTVGVGIPISVSFSQPVVDKAAVERALLVKSSAGTVVGAWHWFADDTATYRPKTYWPANSRVTVQAALAGVDAGDEVWGTADSAPVTFDIGNSVINHVDLASDELTVVVNGKVARTIPVTGGQAGMHTRTGVSIISQKYQNIQMDSESVGYAKGSANYYNLMVHWAMRITDSGEFLHAAPWSVYAQGSENVSHGCVGMSTENAEWLYAMTNIGDVAQVTGTDRPLEQGNGWTDFNMSWAQWLAGSALHGSPTAA